MPATKSPNIMTIRRRGEFIVSHVGKNKNQCGPLGTQVLRYFVAIVSKSYRLNDQGFIIDNNDIQQYFQTRFKKVNEFVSCEKIAEFALSELLAKFGKGTGNASKVYGICVVITGAPGMAELECAWVDPKYENNAQIQMAMRPSMAI